MINFVKRIIDKFFMKYRLIKNNNCSFALINSKGYGLVDYKEINEDDHSILSINFSKTYYKLYSTFHAVYTIREDFYKKTGIFLDVVIEPKEVENE